MSSTRRDTAQASARGCRRQLVRNLMQRLVSSIDTCISTIQRVFIGNEFSRSSMLVRLPTPLMERSVRCRRITAIHTLYVAKHFEDTCDNLTCKTIANNRDGRTRFLYHSCYHTLGRRFTYNLLTTMNRDGPRFTPVASTRALVSQASRRNKLVHDRKGARRVSLYKHPKKINSSSHRE